ncbi:hypothetical protein EDD37DRAFT_629152 [Exophiala viscosa]|uniref:uncharacterized protein n=1 Tax=Exophiala viscosa TaxID=2486360 RepID=UPI002194C0B7|nr:hypothetical protein EDD37DRAFT_629152 [Exophiala viscosa]
MALGSHHDGLTRLTHPIYTLTAEPTVFSTISSFESSASPTSDNYHLPTAVTSLDVGPTSAIVVVEPSPATAQQGVIVHDSVAKDSLQAEEMGGTKTKVTIGVLSTIISYMCLNSMYRDTNPEAFIWQDEDWEDSSWMATSKSWLDRKCCRWIGVCGGLHMHWVSATDIFGHRPLVDGKSKKLVDKRPKWDWQHAWTEGNDRPEDWADDERVLREIPDYVMEYAPLVHLYSGEQFWPCDIAEHLYHITPTLNYTPVRSGQDHLTLQNLDRLNEYQPPRWVYLTSNDNVEERPAWLEGEKNIPSEPSDVNDLFEDNDGWVHKPGRTYVQGMKHAISDLKDWLTPEVGEGNSADDFRASETAQSEQDEDARRIHQELKRSTTRDHTQEKFRGGRSGAPAVLVTVNKGHGIVDAFWFFFYSFNLGNVVLNVRFGNHVGDWEHTAVRFQHGEPKAVFFSEHNFGSAYTYDAVEKLGKRPVIYSAYGTHAMYATPGTHPYVLPWGILHDMTDRGPLWDPALNSHAYTYDYKTENLRSSNLTPSAPTEWFHYGGHWGDKFYPLGDRRQYRFAGQYHYVNGPYGPKFKNLARKKICQGPESAPCVIKNWLGLSDKIGHLHLANENEEEDL